MQTDNSKTYRRFIDIPTGFIVEMKDAEERLKPLGFSQEQLEEAKAESLSVLTYGDHTEEAVQDIIDKGTKHGLKPEDICHTLLTCDTDKLKACLKGYGFKERLFNQGMAPLDRVMPLLDQGMTLQQCVEASPGQLTVLTDARHQGTLDHILERENANGATPAETWQTLLACDAGELASVLYLHEAHASECDALRDRGATFEQCTKAHDYGLHQWLTSEAFRASCDDLIHGKYASLSEVLALNPNHNCMTSRLSANNEREGFLTSLKALCDHGIAFKDVMCLEDSPASYLSSMMYEELLTPEYQAFRDTAMKRGVKISDFATLFDIGEILKEDGDVVMALLSDRRHHFPDNIIPEDASHDDILQACKDVSSSQYASTKDKMSGNTTFEGMKMRDVVSILYEMAIAKNSIDLLYSHLSDRDTQQAVEGMLIHTIDAAHITKDAFVAALSGAVERDGSTMLLAIHNIQERMPDHCPIKSEIEITPSERVLKFQDEAWVDQTVKPRELQTRGAAEGLISARTDREGLGVGCLVGDFLGVNGNNGVRRTCVDINRSAKSFLDAYLGGKTGSGERAGEIRACL